MSGKSPMHSSNEGSPLVCTVRFPDNRTLRACATIHNRRAWFLYEFLTGRMLDIEDAAEAGFTDLLDNRVYFTGAPVPSRRHKVRDNLLGNKDFCPIIRRTKTLTDFGSRALGEKANEIIGHTGANVVARAASFLLLADSRASFEIEGEKPPRKRLERWGRAVVQAGKAMRDVFGSMPRCRIALETGTHSPWVSRLLSELGHEVMLLLGHCEHRR